MNAHFHADRRVTNSSSKSYRGFPVFKVILSMFFSFKLRKPQRSRSFRACLADKDTEPQRVQGHSTHTAGNLGLELMSSCSKHRALSMTPCCLTEIRERLPGKGVSGTSARKGTLTTFSHGNIFTHGG